MFRCMCYGGGGSSTSIPPKKFAPKPRPMINKPPRLDRDPNMTGFINQGHGSAIWVPVFAGGAIHACLASRCSRSPEEKRISIAIVLYPGNSVYPNHRATTC